ncbi:transketolase family protein [Faecalimonas umbilicata]|mgnify:CR=1 FL=1|uniref:transketolase family protein n=1 Tax=Faecalimonas umbilicata TaxID=1912855 RepID=UPI0022E97131|nr:transketolase C-terminal domain-containing protein [Faecalimonas umbilicata]
MVDLSQKNFLRDVIGEYMVELGRENSRVTVVNADLMGTCRNRTFNDKFPNRCFNVGIAEQNMVSFSAGLAQEGFIPFAFSMAPFISMRACEQCRTDIAYGNLNVRLIATYAGVSGGISGATHWSIEDCAIMSAIPNMVVLEPSDPVQAKRMLDASLEYNGPIYMRSSVEPVPNIYDETYSYELGKASIVMDGNDGTIICSGIVVKYAIEAAMIIYQKIGKRIKVVDMHTIKPIDRKAIIESASTGNIIVAQDHNVIGGLGQQVASIIAEEGLQVRFKNIGIRDEFTAMAHAPYLYHKYGYDKEGLVNTLLEFLDN